MGRRQAPAPARGRRRIREAPRGRARSPARSGQREPAQAQLQGLARCCWCREVYWDYCASEVMVMQRMRGTPVSQRGRAARAGRRHPAARARRRGDLLHAGVPRRLLPRRHASRQHPRHARTASYVALDFGIMGTLTDIDKKYLAQNFLAFFRRDYRRVAEVHIESGWAPRETRVDDFEAAIRAVCEPIFAQAAEGNLVRPRAAAAVPDLAPLQHPGPAAARAAAEDPAQHRGAGARARSRPRPVGRPPSPTSSAGCRSRSAGAASCERVRQEAPYWSTLLPQLPRLLHQALDRAAGERTDGARNDLLLLQRQRNRILTVIAALLALIATLLMLAH